MVDGHAERVLRGRSEVRVELGRDFPLPVLIHMDAFRYPARDVSIMVSVVE